MCTAPSHPSPYVCPAHTPLSPSMVPEKMYGWKNLSTATGNYMVVTRLVPLPEPPGQPGVSELRFAL